MMAYKLLQNLLNEKESYLLLPIDREIFGTRFLLNMQFFVYDKHFATNGL
jgi:hypothetical protein